MIAVFVIIVYLILGFFEIMGLKKRRQRRTIVVYTLLFSIAFILSLLLSLNVKLPSLERTAGDAIMQFTGRLYE